MTRAPSVAPDIASPAPGAQRRPRPGPPLPPNNVAAWTTVVLGTGITLRPTLSPHVWEVGTTASRRRYFVKHIADLDSFQHETYAHRQVLTALAPELAPRLVAASLTLRTVITTALPGIPVNATHLPVSARTDVYHQTGAFLARLHQARQPTPGQRAHARTSLRCAARAATRLLAATTLLSRGERDFVQEQVDYLYCVDSRAEFTIGYVHGALTEARMVRTVDTHTVGLVNYGRSRYAAVVHDLARLAPAWRDRDFIRRAFFQGYGRRLTITERRLYLALVTLDAATQLISHPAPGDRATRTSRLLLTRAINGDKV